jgi:Anti-sigma factor NepR
MEPKRANHVAGGRCEDAVLARGGLRPQKTRVRAGRDPAAGQACMAKNDEERQPKTDMTASVAKTVRRTSDPTVQAAIGRKLRALYDEVANEPVPERFSELLKQLADQENQDR